MDAIGGKNAPSRGAQTGDARPVSPLDGRHDEGLDARVQGARDDLVTVRIEGVIVQMDMGIDERGAMHGDAALIFQE